MKPKDPKIIDAIRNLLVVSSILASDFGETEFIVIIFMLISEHYEEVNCWVELCNCGTD